MSMAGGCSWTKHWLKFDNSYFQRGADANGDKNLLWLPSDRALETAPEFRPHFLAYARDQRTFFREYADAHKKMSDLGARFDPPDGISLIDNIKK